MIEFLKIQLQSPLKVQNRHIGLDDSISFCSDLLHYCYKKQNCPAPFCVIDEFCLPVE